MSIFSGIAITTVVSALVLYFMADKLVYWMHGAEGPAPEEKTSKSLIEEDLDTAESY